MTEACTFCGKPRVEVAGLVAGPAGLYICDGCIARGIHEVDVAQSTTETCMFCRSLKDDTHFAADDGLICASCLLLCAEILDEVRAQLPVARVIDRKP